MSNSLQPGHEAIHIEEDKSVIYRYRSRFTALEPFAATAPSIIIARQKCQEWEASQIHNTAATLIGNLLKSDVEIYTQECSLLSPPPTWAVMAKTPKGQVINLALCVNSCSKLAELAANNLACLLQSLLLKTARINQ